MCEWTESQQTNDLQSKDPSHPEAVYRRVEQQFHCHLQHSVTHGNWTLAFAHRTNVISDKQQPIHRHCWWSRAHCTSYLLVRHSDCEWSHECRPMTTTLDCFAPIPCSTERWHPPMFRPVSTLHRDYCRRNHSIPAKRQTGVDWNRLD